MKTHPDKRRSETHTAPESLIKRRSGSYRQRMVAVRLFASPDLLDISVLRHAETQSPHLKNAFFEIAAKGAFGDEVGV